MEFSLLEVERIAKLARLRLTAAELEEMAGQLGRIVEYVGQLSELETEGIEPMAHVEEMTNVFRDDALAPSLPREAALANAPKHNGACYLVPAVFGDG